MNKDELKLALNYGAIYGVIAIVFSVVLYVMGIMPVGIKNVGLKAIVELTLMVVMMLVGMKKTRDQLLNGNITFGKAFVVGVMIVVGGSILMAIYNFIFNNYIDPEYSRKVLEESIIQLEEMMMNLGQPDELIEQQSEQLRVQYENLTPLSQLWSAIQGGLLGGGLVSLILAAILKKETNPLGISDSEVVEDNE